MTDATLDRDVRLHVFRHAAETGEVPPPDATATALGVPRDAVDAALRRLADAHVLVLAPSTTNVWMANPFSAVPTPFRVEARGRAYWGNCVWDALGVAAVLGADARVATRCPDCGDPLALEVRGGQLTAGTGVIHFAVPALRWWENIGFT